MESLYSKANFAHQLNQIRENNNVYVDQLQGKLV